MLTKGMGLGKFKQMKEYSEAKLSSVASRKFVSYSCFTKKLFRRKKPLAKTARNASFPHKSLHCGRNTLVGDSI